MKTILPPLALSFFYCAIILAPRNAGSSINKENNFLMPVKNNAAITTMPLNDFTVLGFPVLHIHTDDEDKPINFNEAFRISIPGVQNAFTSLNRNGNFRIGVRWDNDCWLENLMVQRAKEDSCDALLNHNSWLDSGISLVADTCWLEDLLQTINIDSCMIDFYTHDTIHFSKGETIPNIFLHGY